MFAHDKLVSNEEFLLPQPYWENRTFRRATKNNAILCNLLKLVYITRIYEFRRFAADTNTEKLLAVILEYDHRTIN